MRPLISFLLLSISIIGVFPLPLETTPADLHPSHPSQLFPRYAVHCLDPPLYDPIRPNHCYETARLLFCRPNTSRNMVFSRRPRFPEVGFKVPFSWIMGTCSITVDIADHVDPTTEETSRISAVATRALEIVRTCVDHGPHKGGWSTVGTHDNLKVLVRGRVNVEGEKDKDWKHCLRGSVNPLPSDLGPIHYA